MKTKRILLILIILCPLLLLHAQDPESAEVFYAYELIAGQASHDGDTTYQAFLILDSLEVLKFDKLVVLNDKQEKVVSIKPKDLYKDQKLTSVGASYRIDLDRWSDIPSWIVFGEKADKSKKYFKSQDRKAREKDMEKLIHFPIPVTVAPIPDTTVVNN